MRNAIVAATAVAALAAGGVGVGAAAQAAQTPARHTATPSSPSSPTNCQLANGIKHVVQVDFDNVHLTRDNPNVASDLEQMPALLNFMKSQGVLMTNTHDDLVHTGTNMISDMTGLYPDRDAITQSNSGDYYDPSGATHPDSSFAYWTDSVYDPSGGMTDQRYNMDYLPSRTQAAPKKSINVPAPWVPFTEAGCNVGEVGSPNTVLENTTSDVTKVFGAGSPQAAEAATNPTKAQADMVGFAVHCAKTSRLCASGETDALPDEPGGYAGYKALFGAAQIQPVISPSGPVRSTDGKIIADPTGNPGFPGFDSETPNNSLGYGAQMLEHGVQDVNIYVSDAHGDHTAANTGDMGPGQQTFTQQLASYNAAFATFFARLKKDGITPANTLFTFTTDEGDHFAGTAPTPANCTGTPGNYCNYKTRSEVDVNLPGLLATQAGNTTPFAIHDDPAPALWVEGNPARNSSTVRALDHAIAKVKFTNPYTAKSEPVAYSMADTAEEKILHFVSADAARTPTLTLFSGEDSYVGSGAANCNSSCVYTSQGYAWNHGGDWSDMQDIWAGYVGPGISARGTNTTFTDQVDMRPTIMTLTGLRDSYQVDGVPLLPIISPKVLSPQVRAHEKQLIALSAAYKQLTAPTGQFAMATLKMSTAALTSTSPGDSTYINTEKTLTGLCFARDSLAQQMEASILGAIEGRGGFSSGNVQSLTSRSNGMLRTS
ncbi:hypothetical protein [Rudaeicoccus suwonensis]|uniref:Phosphoesterase family protein n=1 Tax=Rudaeicoccus suwonensis TaxID=657409 RepID=A0A561E8C3_9MICO|nr:hypothetical protein [Rudaeicoccus suwonensis]TWE11857.1 hypothetical protein BKA23_0650 [Rudaeicoccus suwonensis]